MPPPDPGIEISIASTGMSKGLSQTDGVQVVGRGELAFGKVYIGALAKNLTSPSAEGELQLSTGGRFKLRRADLSVSVAYKRWLDTSGQPDDVAAELTVSASQAVGKVTPGIQLIYSPDDLGSTTYSIYAEAGIGWKPFSDLRLSANVGRRHRGNGIDYTSANVGAAYALTRNFTAELRLFDTNKNDLGDPFKRRIVGSIRAKF
jgi:hypothetical protein